MKNRILIILLCVFIFLFSVGGTYYLVEYTTIFDPTNDRTLKNVEVTSSSLYESINKVYNSVFVVENYKGKELQSTGTGFVYKIDSKYGYVLTNEHVIENNTKIILTSMTGEEIDAKLLGSDEFIDLAVLQIPLESVSLVAQIGASEEANLGDIVFTVGTPLGKDYYGSVTKGILSGKDRLVEVNLTDGYDEDWVMKVLQTDASINPGNSGGPLCNVNGEVIGINSLKYAEETIEGMGFAIPIEYAMAHVETLENGEEIKRPYLGIFLIDLDNSYSLLNAGLTPDENVEQGTVVESVEKGMPAETAGLKRGDIILKIDDEEITSSAYLRYILYKYNVGDTITITYYRNGKTLETEVLLSEEYNSET